MTLLRTVLGSRYRDFENEVLVSGLKDLAAKSRLDKKTLDLILLGIEKGEGVLIKEELLEHQTRTARNGGALVQVTASLPGDIALHTFVKVGNKRALQKEAQLTRELHALGLESVLPIQYADTTVLATPFIEGKRAYDLLRATGDERIVEKCLGALLDGYEKTSGKKLSILNTSGSVFDRAQRFGFERIAGHKLKSKETHELKAAYDESIGNALNDELQVALHGDPNLGNFLIAKDKAIVLDWESARKGGMSADLYKLFLRSGVDREKKAELLSVAHEFAVQKLGSKKSKEEFKKQYFAAEIHEHLFVAGEFKELSKSARDEESVKALNAGASLYYTQAVKSAQEQGFNRLANVLEEAASSMLEGKVRVLKDASYDEAMQYDVARQGFSSLYGAQLPVSQEDVVRELTKRARNGSRKNYLKYAAVLGSALALGGFGVFAKGTKNGKEQVVEKPKYSAVELILHYDGLSNRLDEFAEYKSTDDYWYYLHDDKYITEHLKLPLESYKKLFREGEVKAPCGCICGYGLVPRKSVEFGLPGSLGRDLIWANLTTLSEDRDEITGLPPSVLVQISGKQELSIEEKVSLSAEHFRRLLEKQGMKLMDTVSEYYCGDHAFYQAQSKARDGKLEHPTDFATYVRFLPLEGQKRALRIAKLWSIHPLGHEGGVHDGSDKLFSPEYPKAK